MCQISVFAQFSNLLTNILNLNIWKELATLTSASQNSLTNLIFAEASDTSNIKTRTLETSSDRAMCSYPHFKKIFMPYYLISKRMILNSYRNNEDIRTCKQYA